MLLKTQELSEEYQLQHFKEVALFCLCAPILSILVYALLRSTNILNNNILSQFGLQPRTPTLKCNLTLRRMILQWAEKKSG